MERELPVPPRPLTRRLSDTIQPDSGTAGKALPQAGVLEGLSEKSLENLGHYGRYEQVEAGTVLITEGKKQDRFYVIVSGELTVTTTKGKREVQLSVVKAGECLGEVSLLEPGPASATVRVTKAATLWSMDIHDLRVYILDHAGGAGALLMGMATCLSARLREANEVIRKNHKLPVETLPAGRERAITASNTVVQIGLFDRLKKKVGIETDKKIRISTKIKM
jgi:CRP-like cAMP-binding protein